MIIDNFLESFEDLRHASLNCEFIDELNPADGVVYPLICDDIPKTVETEIIQCLAINIGRPVKNVTMFMRKSPMGIDCPHQVHSDYSMGDYSLMVYVSDGDGGTSLVRHKKTGIAYNPECDEFVKLIVEDQNIHDAWEITDSVLIRPNRAFIFDSRRLHRAEPVGGFGEGKTSRVVFTCFFS